MPKAKKKSSSKWKKIVVVVVVLLLAVVLVGGFGDDLKYELMGGYGEDEAMEEMAYNRSMVDGDFAMDMAVTQAQSSYFPGPVEPLPSAGVEQREIVKTGNLSVVVDDVEMTISSIKELVESYEEGIVIEANSERFDDDSRYGWMQIKVPSGEFDDVMEQLKGLAVRVQSENVRTDDVTGQVVDLEARLRNLRAEESQYLAILEDAEVVEDILNATNYLNDVRWQIENIETQLEGVQERVSLSTIYVNLEDEGDVEIFGVYWRPILEAKQALREAVENVTNSIDFLLALIFNIPLALAWLAIVSLFGWIVWKLGGKKLWNKL